jgi:hypothetical protein
VKRRYYILTAALLSCLFIYVFYRTDKTVVNELVIHFTSPELYLRAKTWITINLPLNNIIIYSVPEALWVLCITVTSKSFFIQLGRARITGAFVPLIYCVGLEICQLTGLTKGTFDPMDVALSMVFWFVGMVAFEETGERQNIFGRISRRTMVCFASYGIVYLSHVT